jgi:dTDP-4-dehydrorhamnose 3,5-epimerase
MTKIERGTPVLVPGGLAVDDRGTVSFANDFDPGAFKRFYVLENFATTTIRAFHGHLKEEKAFFAVAGSAIVAAAPMDDVRAPSKDVEVQRYVLSARKPAVLRIPAGYANGFRALEPGTRIFVFSSGTMEDAAGDDYRFPADYWAPGIWNVEDR